MLKYVIYLGIAEARQFKKYYPLCTTEAQSINQKELESFDTLEAALDEISRPDLYFPTLNNRGVYEEYFVQVEEWDEDGNFIQATELYDWNYRDKYVWRENNRGIEVFELEVARNYMDDEICEEIDRKYLFKSEQDFFNKYLELHEEKYEEEFQI